MKRRPRDEEREQRITMEIVVDAYTPEEQAMGWYYSLEDRLHVPFVARCTAERAVSPLRVGDEVDVVGMAPEEECQHEMFVLIRWEHRPLAVPLGPAGGRRGGRPDPPGDRGLAVLGRSRVRAVSNADLQGGPPAGWPSHSSAPPLAHRRTLN
jgi:Calcium binding